MRDEDCGDYLRTVAAEVVVGTSWGILHLVVVGGGEGDTDDPACVARSQPSLLVIVCAV